MGSSDITSRLMAHTTEDTGLVPAGVTAARPVADGAAPDEAAPDEEAGSLADAVQAATVIVNAAIIVVTATRLCL